MTSNTRIVKLESSTQIVMSEIRIVKLESRTQGVRSKTRIVRTRISHPNSDK